ncbi:MAG TPA: ATP-binding protein [Polyangiaceae bacterium]
MEHATWANFLLAESAGQLVLGSLYCGNYACSPRQVEWLGFGLGCLGLGVGSWACSIRALHLNPSARIQTMAFTVATSIAVALIIFGLAWMTRRRVLHGLGWAALIAGVAWQLVLGYFNPFLPNRVPVATRVLATESPALLTVGWLFLLSLAALIGIATLLFARSSSVPKVERCLAGVGLTILALGLGFDGIDGYRMSATMRAFPHAAAAFVAVLAVVHVIRNRRVALASEAGEQRILQAQHELMITQAALERVQSELGTKSQLAVVGELAAAIAHEVRNPLAIIMNAAAGLRRPTLGSEDRTTLLSILDEETARLNRLVTDLLRFARPVIIKRSAVSITELARRAEGRLEDKHRLSISVPDEPQLRYVQADANLLRLVFDNLVSNAFQAMPDGGVVRIVVSEHAQNTGKFVRIDIVDDGHGMDEQVLARATDPFYTTRPSGTGLGLPIVQRIVEAHGGRIEISSTPGHGTRVSLYLPTTSSAPESRDVVDTAI